VAELEANVEYEISVPAGEEWNDGSIRCGPEGYTRWWLRPFTWLRRHRPAPWFALIGAIGDGEPFTIGGQQVVKPKKPGQLRCYANDASFMYWNNSGSLTVSVARRPAAE
jgi:hypothetical protein